MTKYAARAEALAENVDKLTATARGELYGVRDMVTAINEAVPDRALVPGWLQRVLQEQIAEYESFVRKVKS